MDGLWFLVAIALLRYVWRFVERAARAKEQGPAEVVEERKARRESRRARRLPPPRPQRPATQGSGAPGRAPLEPGDLLERLRQAVETASGARSEPRRPTQPMPPIASAPPPFVLPTSPAAPERALAGESRVHTDDQLAVYRRETARVRDLRVMLRHTGTIRDAVLLREILGPPVAQRDTPGPMQAR